MSGSIAVTGFAHKQFTLAAGSPAKSEIYAFDPSDQVSSRSEIRAQGPSQLLATYVAGLALDGAGIKNSKELLADVDIYVATRGGERDTALDDKILHRIVSESAWGEALNAELSNLRPSLFLAQLQNIFAANISISFGITGRSITFMGGADAGVKALMQAIQRVQSGSAKAALIGGVFNGDRPDIREFYAADMVADDANDFKRCELGQGAGFLVLELEEQAAARGALNAIKLSPISLQSGDRQSARYPNFFGERKPGSRGADGEQALFEAQFPTAIAKACAELSAQADQGAAGITVSIQLPWGTSAEVALARIN